MNYEEELLQTPPVNYGKLQPKYKFRRFELGGHRFYWGSVKKGKKETVKVIKGITSVLDESMPTPKELKLWMRNEENQKIFEESADYGSAVHYATYLYDIQDPNRNFHAFVKGIKHREKVYREVVAWHNFRMKYAGLDLLLIETPLYFEF